MLDETVLSARIEEERGNLATQGAVIAELREHQGNRKSLPIFELIFYIVQQNYDLLVLIDRLLRHEESRSVWMKYLALQMGEALKALPQVGGAVLRHYRNLDNPNHAQLDALQQALSAFRSDVKPLKGGRLNTIVEEVRNSVSAHHLKRGGGSTALVPLIEWTTEHASRAGGAMSSEHQEILSAALTLAEALRRLGAGIQKAVLEH